MALSLDVSKTDGVFVVECRGRIVFGAESDELTRISHAGERERVTAEN